jgi:hypothetical protein
LNRSAFPSRLLFAFPVNKHSFEVWHRKSFKVSVSLSTYDSSCVKASGSTMAAERVSEQAALPCPEIARRALASPGRTAAELAHARTIPLDTSTPEMS